MLRFTCMLAFVTLIGRAAWASTLDQQNDGPLAGGTSVGVITTAVNQSCAQSIVCGLSGTLEHIEMYAYAGGTHNAPLVLEVRPMSGGVPDTAILLATAGVTPASSGLQWFSFDVSAAAVAVTPGQALALVLRSAQDLTIGEYDAEGTAENYGAGGSFYRSFSGPWMPINNYDLMFRTYVNTSTPCPDDLNGDRRVDLGDLAILLANFGDTSASHDDGDVNGDGRVDLSDLAALLSAYGQTCP